MIMTRLSFFLLPFCIAAFSCLTAVHGFTAFHSSSDSRFSSSTTLETTTSDDDATSKKRVSILLCPAQFCVPADYENFFSTLISHKDSKNDDISIGTCRVAPLPRTEWIKVAKQLPTQEFFKGELNVPKTLGWYFDAIESGLAEIFAEEGEDANVAIIGHSIGGWVARAYLGGLSR